MPLKELGTLFPGFVQTPDELLVAKDGWLFAWACDGWMEEAPHDRAKFVLVYRSQLVKQTSALYAPLAQMILEAEDVTVLGQGEVEDSTMMFGSGQYLLMHLADKGFQSPFPLDEIREAVKQVMEDCSA